MRVIFLFLTIHFTLLGTDRYLSFAANFDEIYDKLIFLSLRSERRLQHIQNVITALNTSNYLIMGVNGSEVVQDSTHPFRSYLSERFMQEKSSGQIGCALSHRLAYEVVASSQLKRVLILEDDVQVDAERFLNASMWYHSHISKDWRIVRWFSFCPNGCKRNFSFYGRQHVIGDLYTIVKVSWQNVEAGNQAYVINSNSAYDLLKMATPIVRNSDFTTSDYMHRGIEGHAYQETGKIFTVKHKLKSEINRIDRSVPSKRSRSDFEAEENKKKRSSLKVSTVSRHTLKNKEQHKRK